MSRDTREKRDLHALNEDGMVLCNPRDREAAHRAEMEGIATDDRCGRDVPEVPGPAVQAHEGEAGAGTQSGRLTVTDRDDVIRRACGYRDRILEILDLIGDRPPLDADEKGRARSLYTTLKGKLREDVQAGATIRGRLALTETEKHFFQPAVEQASATLQAATNTAPIRSKWFSQLYSARTDITHALGQLEGQAGSA